MKEYVVVSEVKHVIFEQELNKYAAQGYQILEYKATPESMTNAVAGYKRVRYSAVMERDAV